MGKPKRYFFLHKTVRKVYRPQVLSHSFWRVCECTGVRQEVCGQREVWPGKGRANCSHSWFLPEETKTVVIMSSRTFTFPWETRPYTGGQKNAHKPTLSLYTIHMLNMANRRLCLTIKVPRPYQRTLDSGREHESRGEKDRERGREVTVMKEELLFRSTLLS